MLLKSLRRWLIACAVLLAPAALRTAAQNATETALGPVRVTLDTTEAPDLDAWAAKAKSLVEAWYPRISETLKSEGFTPPKNVKLIFERDKKGVAGTSGATIRISAGYVRKHPDDFGMVIHELTHVIQSYPKPNPHWLVEGIADQVRFYSFEPQTKLPAIDPEKASYRNGYKTAARFLEWVRSEHDRAIVGKLNKALRQSRYDDSLFEEFTGETLDQLWDEFLESQKRH